MPIGRMNERDSHEEITLKYPPFLIPLLRSNQIIQSRISKGMKSDNYYVFDGSISEQNPQDGPQSVKNIGQYRLQIHYFQDSSDQNHSRFEKSHCRFFC
ncbi:MAG: hypothetical protein ACI9A7_000608 [Cyclobacteriaceae bacterium]|jgi:hypothetical protein